MRLALLPVVLSFATAVQAADLKLADTIEGPDGGGWDYATIDTAGHRLLLARPEGLMALDLATKAITPVFVPGKRVHGAAISPSGIGVVANGGGASALVFKAADGSVLGEVPAGKKPDAVVYEPKSGLAAVMDNKDGTVTLVDPDKKAAAGSIDVGGALEFAVADGEGKVFVNVEDKNTLVVVDVPNRKVVARRPLPGCDEPSGLALDPASHVLVSACGNGKAVATSAADGKVLATLPIGAHPDAVLFDAKTKRFLVPCGGDGVVTVIAEDGDSLKVVDTVQTAKSARLGAIDPATGKVYLPAADYQPAAKQGERPTVLPGTFRILVLEQN